ncbi:multiple epidermal growth factor-like domains protein 10 [Ylistrum balloti]|uniref:multiple epidermal growth factor-like domains protein 10 n=1 Tax=Ylistrum balloti TaxID=509963 RepID=UPI002905E78E|nr:multiple epidermal growth factor-like domains protein 10 [Ylistrum balloti]
MKPCWNNHWILHFTTIGCIALLPCFVNSSYNIAKGKPASQSTVYLGWSAVKALDGVIGTDVEANGGGSCSSTNPTGSREAWWSVDLQHISRIKTIKVTYRQLYPFRLSGFYLYVSNTSVLNGQRNTWHMCYHDDIKDPDLLPSFNQSRPCIVDGQYVIFYNKRPADNEPKNHIYYSPTNAVVELCEVQVFGCPINRFGPGCNKRCNCGVGGCDPDTGRCDVTGCQKGWTGRSCSEECGLGLFGVDCSQTCHCFTSGCDRITGRCTLSECAVGWKGNACDSACGTGTFGRACAQTCHCAESGCNPISGSCTQPGCTSGWTGVACDTVCPEGHFGLDCKQTCHCSIPGCDRFNGQCIYTGCLAGWKGLSCDQTCGVGKYGQDCNYACNCATPGCDVISGNCIVPECEVGWEGSICNIACNISTFGSNCDQTCHCTIPGCDRFTGLCNVTGCDVGWTGLSCDKAAQTDSKAVMSTTGASVGYALLGTLLFISIFFNIGLIIDRLRTKRKKSQPEKVDDKVQYQNTLKDTNIYEELDNKVEKAKSIYDTLAK